MNTQRFIKFLNGVKKFPGYVRVSGHIATLVFEGEVPAQSTARGFGWYINDKSTNPDGDYATFDTVYRWDAELGIYQMSADGSVWAPTITFTSNGGTLTGGLVQHVSSYSDLVVPTPIDDSDWEFQNWNPSVPASGVIYNDESYQAVFEYIGIPPVPEPTTEERLTDLGEITNELLYETTMIEMYYPIREESEV